MSDQIFGAQAIHRAVVVLQALADQSGAGARIAQLARRTGLTEPTVARILAALAADGVVERAVGGRGWQLGPEPQLWGTVAAARSGIDRVAREAVLRVVEETGDSVAFWLRSTHSCVCLAAAQGSYPLQPQPTAPGSRLPLVGSTVGKAMAASTGSIAVVTGGGAERPGEWLVAAAVSLTDQSRTVGMTVTAVVDRFTEARERRISRVLAAELELLA